MSIRQQKNSENDLHSHVSQQRFDLVKNANDEQQNYQHSQYVQFVQKQRKHQCVTQSQKNATEEIYKETHRRRKFQSTSF